MRTKMVTAQHFDDAEGMPLPWSLEPSVVDQLPLHLMPQKLALNLACVRAWG